MEALTVPSAMDQRDTIASLESGEESVHVYAVTKLWYDRWTVHVGLTDSKDNKIHIPGELTMDPDNEDNNMYVDEKIWLKWVEWYGVAPQHQLDRRNCASDERDIEICILTPYSGILHNPRKTCDITEETGYVELQLRRIFSVPEVKATRLWVCERTRHARFVQLLDRTRKLSEQESIDSRKDYILALEVANMDGNWPSHNPGIPNGDFHKYTQLVGKVKGCQYWEQELSNTLQTVFGGIVTELNESISGIVKTTKFMTQQKEKDIGHVKDKLETRVRGVEEVQKSLNKKAKDILQEEDVIKTEVRRLKRDREHFDAEKQKFHEELKRAEELNKIRESKIRLNIGGHMYMTSTMTVSRDPDSMLSAMFSGRHSICQEEDGSYFIDRDGTHFRFILNFLRDGGFRDGTLPKEKGFLNELLTEAEYYQIGMLVKLLKDTLDGKANDGSDAESSPKPDRKPTGKRPHRKVALINQK